MFYSVAVFESHGSHLAFFSIVSKYFLALGKFIHSVFQMLVCRVSEGSAS